MSKPKNKLQNIFDIYDILHNIFEYVEFKQEYMLYNRAFYKLAKTCKTILRFETDIDLMRVMDFEHYGQLFVKICNPDSYGCWPSVSDYKFIRDSKNVTGLGLWLIRYIDFYIFNIVNPNIKKIHAKTNYYDKYFPFVRCFPSLEELSLIYCKSFIHSRKHHEISLLDEPLYNKPIINNNTLNYVKKMSVYHPGNVTCQSSDIVEYLSVRARNISFAERCCEFTKLKHLVFHICCRNWRLDTYNFEASHVKIPHLETLEFTSNINPTKLLRFPSLKKISVVCGGIHRSTTENKIQYIKKILRHNIPSFDLVMPLHAKNIDDIDDMRKFCKENGIRILYE